MYRIGIDLGGTNIAVGVIDESYNIIGRGKVKTRAPRPAEAIFDSIKEAVDMAVVNAGINYDGMAPVDLAGKKRKSGKYIDIGCYECYLPCEGTMVIFR